MVEESDIMHGAIRTIDFDEGVFGAAHFEIIGKEDFQQLFEHTELGIAVIHTYIHMVLRSIYNLLSWTIYLHISMSSLMFIMFLFKVYVCNIDAGNWIV